MPNQIKNSTKWNKRLLSAQACLSQKKGKNIIAKIFKHEALQTKLPFTSKNQRHRNLFFLQEKKNKFVDSQNQVLKTPRAKKGFKTIQAKLLLPHPQQTRPFSDESQKLII